MLYRLKKKENVINIQSKKKGPICFKFNIITTVSIYLDVLKNLIFYNTSGFAADTFLLLMGKMKIEMHNSFNILIKVGIIG